MAGKKLKKSLAEQLADLSKPTPVDIEPEHDGFYDETQARAGDSDAFDESGSEDDIRVQKSTLRIANADIELDSKFQGKAVSRKQLAHDSGESSAAESLEKNDGSSDVDDETTAFSDGLSEGESVVDSDHAEGLDDAAKSLSDASEFDDEEDLDKQMRALEKQDTLFSKNSATKSASQAVKAQHTRNQKIFWESILDVRMKLQKVFHNGNRLPQGEAIKDYSSADKKVRTSLLGLTSGLQLLLDSLLLIQQQLLHKSQIEVPTELGKRKHDNIDECWSMLSDLDDLFSPHAADVIERWRSKTQVTSGAGLTKRFKAVDQGVMTQVEAILADPDRYKRRAFAKEGQFSVIGKEQLAPSQPEKTMAAEDDDLDVAEVGQRRVTESYDENIYEDVDFYQQLLKEFMEIDSSAANHGFKRGEKSKKTRKDVDQRASKGRKIRYVVHPKIQNFTYPIPYLEPPMDIDELYASLFGQRKANSSLA